MLFTEANQGNKVPVADTSLPSLPSVIWMLLGAITLMVFVPGCASRKPVVSSPQSDLAIIMPPGLPVGRASARAAFANDAPQAAVVTPPAPALLFLDDDRYLKTSGDGGWRNSITFYWAYPNACEVEHGCADSTNLTPFISCEVAVINTNTATLVLPTKAEHPEWYETSDVDCHPHDHFVGVFQIKLFSTSWFAVKTNDAKGFCWRSLKLYCGTNPPVASTCDAPQIAGGWGDVYDASTKCNGLDVTGVPPGYYFLRATLDPYYRIASHQVLEQLIYFSGNSVTRIEQPALQIQDLGTNGVALTWTNSGASWRLQSSTDLETWTSAENFVGGSPVVFPKNQPKKFFRLVLP